MVSFLSSAALLATIARALPGSPSVRRQRGARFLQSHCRMLLKALNIRCVFENKSGVDINEHAGCLFLPNHMSYLDTLILCAFMPSIFVTSREIEKTPVLGEITRAAGCIFIERRHRSHILRDIDQIATLLNQGTNVTLFPEGTTSPGDRLLDFKKSLLEAAIRSRCRVLPVTLEYRAVDGARYDSSNRDAIAWYGDMTFFPHLLRFAATRTVDVRLSVMPAVAFRQHGCRKQLAADVRRSITQDLYGVT